MTVPSVLIAMGALIVVGFAVFQSVIGVALWYQLRQFLTIAAVQSRLSSMELEMSSLSGQVTKLRTSKAGIASNKKRLEAMQEQTEDPLDGLSEADKALFREFEAQER